MVRLVSLITNVVFVGADACAIQGRVLEATLDHRVIPHVLRLFAHVLGHTGVVRLIEELFEGLCLVQLSLCGDLTFLDS